LSAVIEAALQSRLGFLARGGWQAELMRAVSDVVDRHALASESAETRIADDPRLLREVAERLTVAESYFFRQNDQLERARDVLIGAIERNGSARFWSAGCSRGEEPYSVLALLHEHSPGFAARTEAWATDINAECIATARAGVYSAWSLRGVTEGRKVTHFETVGANAYAVKPHLAGKVNFTHSTIQEQLVQFGAMQFDVILFRNVGIYLTAEARHEVWTGMQGRLSRDGVLLMASTDPLPRRSLFPGLVFANVGAIETATGANGQPERGVALQAGTKRATPTRLRPASRKPLRRGAGTPTRGTQFEQRIEHALRVADRGDLVQASSLLDAIVEERADDRAARFARGRVLLALGDHESALRDLSSVNDHGGAVPVADYYATMCLSQLGRTDVAVRRLRALEDRLRSLAPDACVGGSLPHGDCTACELLGAVRSDLRRLT